MGRQIGTHKMRNILNINYLYFTRIVLSDLRGRFAGGWSFASLRMTVGRQEQGYSKKEKCTRP